MPGASLHLGHRVSRFDSMTFRGLTSEIGTRSFATGLSVVLMRTERG
jgi:hypothetical protein